MSIFTYVGPLIIIVFFGAALLWRARMVKSADTHYANAAVGVVAERLGLQLMGGDPAFNLVVWENRAPQVSDLNPLPHQAFDYQIQAQGMPQGRPCRFFFQAKREASAKLPVVGRTITDTYACILDVATQGPLPYFELVSVSQNAYLQPNMVFSSRTDMQQVPGAFQNPSFDAAFSLSTNDPRIAPMLARALPMLAGIQWIHLVGQPGSVSVHFPRAGHYAFTAQAELYLQAVLTVAAMAEGRA